jgi:hypothetical protein
VSCDWVCSRLLLVVFGGHPGIDRFLQPGIEQLLRVPAGEHVNVTDEACDLEPVFLPLALSQRQIGEALLQLGLVLGGRVVADQQSDRDL